MPPKVALHARPMLLQPPDDGFEDEAAFQEWYARYANSVRAQEEWAMGRARAGKGTGKTRDQFEWMMGMHKGKGKGGPIRGLTLAQFMADASSDDDDDAIIATLEAAIQRRQILGVATPVRSTSHSFTRVRSRRRLQARAALFRAAHRMDEAAQVLREATVESLRAELMAESAQALLQAHEAAQAERFRLAHPAIDQQLAALASSAPSQHPASPVSSTETYSASSVPRSPDPLQEAGPEADLSGSEDRQEIVDRTDA